MKIQGFSARTRAAVRVCAVLAPLAVTSACRTESDFASRADDPARPATPEASATSSAAAAATAAGSMGNSHAGAGSAARAKADESAAATGTVDLKSPEDQGWRPSTVPAQAVLGHGQSVGGIGLSGGSAFASPPAVVAAGPAMMGRALRASGNRPVAAASPGGCTPADPLCSSASSAKGLQAAQFGMIGLMSAPAANGSTPAA